MIDLATEYRRLHEGEQFKGLTVIEYRKSIIKLVNRLGAKTLLDYGSGKGEAWPALSHWMRVKVRCYDPYFPKHAKKPAPGEKFDGVVCCDVLEHIPEEQLDDVIDALFGHARMFVWASACCRPAKKFFSDGETNMHITVKPIEWWESKFTAAAQKHPGIEYLLKETP